MSRSDATETEPSVSAGEAPSGTPGAPEHWMHRDDEFLLEADREYVIREEQSWRSWRSWISPVLFGVGLAVLVGDAVTIGVGMAMGTEAAHPVAGPLVAELGLGGLVLLKSMVAVLLVLMPGVTDSARQTLRAGAVAVVAIGLLVAVSHAWAVFTLAG